MNQCLFCGPTGNPLTEEHVWPVWVSRLLKGKYGSDHFVHLRSTGDSTTGIWKAPVLKITTKTLCDKCNNVWLGAFENEVVKPIASPLILGESVDIIRPADQERLAAWAYKMALLLEVVVPQKERAAEFFTAAERFDFRQTTLPNEHVRVLLANFKYGQEPAHAHQHQHTLTRRDDQITFERRICTITAGCMALQVFAIRRVDTGGLAYATSEMEVEFLGRAKTAIAHIWPPTSNAVRWSNLDVMSKEDIEEFTEMWSKAEGLFWAGGSGGPSRGSGTT
jgi:hypothetical protein